ncbi:polysaccharide deacetylase [Allosediminivita pacifica]|uniref:Polysaccharide deacetylase n=1 Tax=Allosediminivita pacifica TaxID=1267769 RepID=A0A2T6ANK1_9RHOB|nr:polysaccharide deacetylase [Allosediminivita pacifica]PTX45385.1 hypothetical protein C8N44_12240 [Allosediminivita pacifica]GGB20866.1 polysaccharide deacetylase [Allosediminivita pacifica]
MLEDHGRFAYSSIDSRPDYSWPEGKRLAVYVAMNIEVFRYGKGKGLAMASADQSQGHSFFSFREYGNRVGYFRLMDLADELDLPLEHQLNVAVYDHAPEIVARARARGDEFLGHGLTNSDAQAELTIAEEKALIDLTTSKITENERTPPLGWMAPWLSNSGETLDMLQEAGYGYSMDWTMDDQPIWAKTRNGKILLMPYPVELNDGRSVVYFGHSPATFADLIVWSFDEMLKQSEKQPLVMPVSLHTFLMGRPYRIPELRRAFQHIISHRDKIWLTRPGEIYKHICALPKGTVPGDDD